MNADNRTITVLTPIIRAYAGEHALRREELGTGASSLPDASIAHLGVKKVINPEHLKAFEKYRKRAWASVSRRGIRILDGYGQNPDLTAEVMEEVQGTLTLARQDAANVVANWDTLVEEWANAHPQWSDMIRRGAPTRDWVRSRFEFGIQAYPLSLEVLQSMGITGNALVSEVEGLGDKLVRELTSAAKEMWQDFMTREKIGKVQLQPLVAMAEKAKALSFLDRRAGQVSHAVTRVLDGLPPAGPYERELPEILKALRMVMQLDTAPSSEPAPDPLPAPRCTEPPLPLAAAENPGLWRF